MSRMRMPDCKMSRWMSRRQPAQTVGVSPVLPQFAAYIMDSHGPISIAVIFAFTWAALAVVNNVSLKRRPGWDYVELSTFCWGTKWPHSVV